MLEVYPRQVSGGKAKKRTAPYLRRVSPVVKSLDAKSGRSSPLVVSIEGS